MMAVVETNTMVAAKNNDERMRNDAGWKREKTHRKYTRNIGLIRVGTRGGDSEPAVAQNGGYQANGGRPCDLVFDVQFGGEESPDREVDGVRPPRIEMGWQQQAVDGLSDRVRRLEEQMKEIS